MLRSPIVSVLGHVDHGKSSVLDAIRGTNIIANEAGKITQAIGASIVPMSVIRKRCGPMLAEMHKNFTIPGLLFIDTPGHAAFTNLRKRGGNLADIAVVVIDIREGFKPQTLEAIDILRSYKTPFIIAANKVDLIHGYQKKHEGVLKDIGAQRPEWITTFETKLYEIVGRLHEHAGLEAERFDRVGDFTKQVAIVPTSAFIGQGINELLMVLAGLAQKFLEQNLKLDVAGPGKGTILEVKETTGFGPTIDVILYDGVIRRNDTIVIGAVGEPLVTKVRAVLEPNPLQEMRDKKSKYTSKQEVAAATGVKIAAPGLGDAIAGMPVRVALSQDDVARISHDLREEVEEVLIQTERDGVILKADTLGSLEALHVMLKEKEIPVRKASVGQISRKDIVEAEANFDQEPLYAVVLGFNIDPADSTEHAQVFTSPVIYELLDKLEEWHEKVRKDQQSARLDELTRPCKVEVLQNCIFRQSNPCVAGVEVLQGTLRSGMPLMNAKGKHLTYAKSMQRNKESVKEGKFGEQIALSMPDVTAGRQIDEHDILYSFLTEDEFRLLKKNADVLESGEKAVLKEIADIMRQERPLWGL